MEVFSQSMKPGRARRPLHVPWEAGPCPETQEDTRVVEEAWRSQEASKSLKGRRLGQGP